MIKKTYLIIFFKDGNVEKARTIKELIEKTYDVKRITLDETDFSFAKTQEPRVTITLTADVKKNIIDDFHLTKNISFRNGYNY